MWGEEFNFSVDELPVQVALLAIETLSLLGSDFIEILSLLLGSEEMVFGLALGDLYSKFLTKIERSNLYKPSTLATRGGSNGL